MDGTAVNAMKDGFAQPHIEEIEGRTRVLNPSGWTVHLPPVPVAQHVGLQTLTGLRDYLEANVDGLERAKLMLHVTGAAGVVLCGVLESEATNYRRNVYLAAAAQPCPATFGKYLDAEAFTIEVQTAYVSSVDRDNLLRLVSSISENNVRNTEDDGYGQEVVVQRGITLNSRERIPNPVMLAPYRTFREVDQPTSPFVVRVRKGQEAPEVALFEADGGTWKLAAIQNVAEWLRENVKGVAVVA